MTEFDKCEQIANFLRETVKIKPVIGIVCGSGLGNLADLLEDAQVFEYKDIPNFPVSTVQGHDGKLVFGLLSGKPVVCMKGRFHPYEGYSSDEVVRPIRVFSRLGVETVILTNASGGISEHLRRGDIMIINDHINLPGLCYNNPLFGKNDERFGTRFPPMSNTYSLKLRLLMKKVAAERDITLQEGVYTHVGGPSFETPAECRMLRMMGGDTVGMSTVPEVIVAHHCGVAVVALSIITNEVVMSKRSKGVAGHEEVLETANITEKNVKAVVTGFVEAYTVGFKAD